MVDEHEKCETTYYSNTYHASTHPIEFLAAFRHLVDVDDVVSGSQGQELIVGRKSDGLNGFVSILEDSVHFPGLRVEHHPLP